MSFHFETPNEGVQRLETEISNKMSEIADDLSELRTLCHVSLCVWLVAFFTAIWLISATG